MNKTPRKFYFDVEFHEHDVETVGGRKIRVVELISIGMIDERGRKFYAVNSDFDYEAAGKNFFLKTHVLDKLPPKSEWKPFTQIQSELFRFIGSQEADFYHWQAPHDELLLYELLSPPILRGGRPCIMALHDSVHMVINIGQKFNDIGRPKGILPPKPANRHDPLADADWDMQADKAIDDYKSRMIVSQPKIGGMQPG